MTGQQRPHLAGNHHLRPPQNPPHRPPLGQVWLVQRHPPPTSH
ncbi:unnamed protein product [Ectocarpus sp. 13 AM-2016]